MSVFDESYFNSGNYFNYLEREDRYIRLAKDIAGLYHSINLIHPNDSILDYGCATGFLLNGLHQQGLCNTYGYDISEWAKSKIKPEHKMIELNQRHIFDHCFCLDVLEHMTDEDIKSVFTQFVTSSVLTVRMPVSLDGKRFHLAQSRLDKTHINCKKRGECIDFLGLLGYELLFTLNLSQIYDSDGVFCATFKGARDGL
jgi:hypothetical protein